MRCRLDWFVYRRPLRRPLATAYGVWRVRTGIVLRLETPAGLRAFGEVAPLEAFGTESLETALAALTALDHSFVLEAPLAAELPALAAGLGAARHELLAAAAGSGELPAGRWANALLLAVGPGLLREVEQAWAAGYRTFKLKVGLGAGCAQEQAWVRALDASLPDNAWLRLDPNGAWSGAELAAWTPILQGMEHLEFVEQPLPAGAERGLALWARESGVPTALDESLVGPGALERWVGAWDGPLVLKPAALGDPADWLPLVRGQGERLVLSSAFETAFGLRHLLRWAGHLEVRRALGLGTLESFDDDAHGPLAGSGLDAGALDGLTMDALWMQLHAASAPA